MEVSVIVPFLNEEDNLSPMTEQLRGALERQHRTWEVLLVDDGSCDGSLAEARSARSIDSRFRIVELKQHMGKSAALAAGRDRARGRTVLTIDADLQDPPEAVPDFLDKLDRGFDVVTAWRRNRKEPWYRRAATGVFNRLMTVYSGVQVHDINAGLKAYRRHVIEAIPLSRGMHRFLPVFAHGHGYSVAEIPVEHRERLAGRTKYGLWRYVETVVSLLLVFFLWRGPEEALSRLVRTALWLLALGATLLIAGWLGSWTVLLVLGCAMAILATQLFVGRLIAEIRFPSFPAMFAAADAGASESTQDDGGADAS